MRMVHVIGVEGESLAPTQHKRAVEMIKRGKAMVVTIQLIERRRGEKDGNTIEGGNVRPDPDSA